MRYAKDIRIHLYDIFNDDFNKAPVQQGALQGGRGFTLIELLIVVAIIALLVSILLPSLSSAKELARKVTCQMNERNTGSALLMYANDNASLILPSASADGAWWQIIPPYIGLEQITRAKYPNRPQETTIMCPSNATYMDTWNNAYGVSYAMNNRTGIRWSNGSTQWMGTKLSDITKPTDRFFLADGRRLTVTSGFGGTYEGTWYWSDPGVWYATYDYQLGRDIHPGDGANFLWADGHVSYEDYANWQTDNDWDGSGSGWWTLTLDQYLYETTVLTQVDGWICISRCFTRLHRVSLK